MKITPTQNNLLLEKVEKDHGTLIMPENHEESYTYKILAISEDIPAGQHSLKVGDEILAMVNNSVPLDGLLGIKQVLCNYMQVQCVIERGPVLINN